MITKQKMRSFAKTLSFRGAPKRGSGGRRGRGSGSSRARGARGANRGRGAVRDEVIQSEGIFAEGVGGGLRSSANRPTQNGKFFTKIFVYLNVKFCRDRANYRQSRRPRSANAADIARRRRCGGRDAAERRPAAHRLV